VCASDFADGPLLSVIERVLTTGARVLVLCHTISPDRAADLLLAGASGYLSSPDVDALQLVEAIREVARGNAALHPAAATAVLAQWRSLRKQPDDASSQTLLTDREVDVLSAIAAGLTNRGIGQRLGVSAKTVEAHKSRIFTKLGVKNQAHALTLASAQGLLRLPAATGTATLESESTSD
jgi:two-component system nitrate/nitrite response regulator NarL